MITIYASGQGVYVVTKDHRQVGRIVNVGMRGRWMFRRDDRAAERDYVGIDVTRLLHNDPVLEAEIAREIA